MLDVYTNGREVSLNFTVPQYKGAEIVPTSISYSVMDEDGEVLVAATPIVGWTSGNPVTVDVADTVNTLAGEQNELRVVVVTYETADDGTFSDRKRYVVQLLTGIEPFKHTFQNLDRAELTAHSLNDIPGWDAATDAQKIAALITGHEAVARLALRYKQDPAFDTIGLLNGDDYTYVKNIREIDADDWASFPQGFKDALMRAQILEADSHLSGDPVRDKRLDGIVSETIGESKMFFNARPPLQLPVTRRALEALSGYFYYRTTLARG